MAGSVCPHTLVIWIDRVMNRGFSEVRGREIGNLGGGNGYLGGGVDGIKCEGRLKIVTTITRLIVSVFKVHVY